VRQPARHHRAGGVILINQQQPAAALRNARPDIVAVRAPPDGIGLEKLHRVHLLHSLI
jgi:hypothetical protein